ncbi:hypothetical protein TVAG_278660 [Trichomonas vaginalis G3]|uniref:Uncharacterized protein n=1 Tax=Trichomonas vaginalis (strain ATCC PRA-98 / G3) TaxID=412133 RepID=A2FXB5_TRIV3|nr:hypothetical protein TVAGG3_0103640 [Trichomonas vaginalis G3]EAX90445.1 hypothetical protein TVAG_278660 [Trichomonas vaginalis G3]KAI5544508.1 hypothetical protein TVAGG3_0103640 [Trichomonas vaginalis G3]|eukprot:XP_001303375.1 hypothetical protein [Trichomonas vaginalis G3]
MIPDKLAGEESSSMDTRTFHEDDNDKLDFHQIEINEYIHFIDQTKYLKPFPSEMITKVLTAAINEINNIILEEIITKIIDTIKDKLYFACELQIQSYIELKFGFKKKIKLQKLKANIEEILPDVMIEFLDELQKVHIKFSNHI